MLNFVQEYGQLYEGLAHQFPSMAQDNVRFQFAAMPLEVNWTAGDAPAAVRWADLVSPSRMGFYQVGSARVLQSSDALLRSADISALSTEQRERLLLARSALAQDAKQWVDGDLPGDVAGWERSAKDSFQVSVDTSCPVDNAWTQSALDGDAPAGLSALFGDAPIQYDLFAKGLALYPVQRGPWYDPMVIAPNLPLIEGGTLRPAHFFGPDGSLQHVAVGLCVLFRPRIALHLPAERPFALNQNGPLEFLGLRFRPVDNDLCQQADGLVSNTLALEGDDMPMLWGVLSRKCYL